MRTLRNRVVAAALLAALLVGPPLRGEDPPPGDLAARTRRGLERGRMWVLGRQRPDGTFPNAYDGTPGSHALVLWTLLAGGISTEDPSVKRGLAYLRENADPELRPTPYGNYTAALALAALYAYYDRRVEHGASLAPAAAPSAGPSHALSPSPPPTVPIAAAETRRAALLALVSPEDRELVRRLVRYVRCCATPERWKYAALGTLSARLREAPLPFAAVPIPVRLEATALPARNRPQAWLGDNSNAQYGWMGLRAGSLLGVSVEDDAFVRAEVERLARTRRSGSGGVLRLERAGEDGFPGLWPGPEIRENVLEGGWAYADGEQLPTMTTGGVASLLYAWQEAEERGLMTPALRLEARAAALGGIAWLFGATKPKIDEG
ncbi:MAG: hypothetical protein HYZ53_18505 [Planctomycetes bacterium]|nr:hypothetical protein [Planctomycetota bacterium]